VEAQLYGPDQEEWFDRLELDYDNVAAALAWSVREEYAEAGLRMAGALSFFFEHRAHFHDGHAWLEQLLASDAPASANVRAKALLTAGVLDYYTGDELASARRFEESLELARAVGDEWIIAWCLSCMGFYEVDLARAVPLLEEALRLFRERGDGWGISHALRRLALEVIRLGDLERAEMLVGEALARARQARNKHALAYSFLILGIVVWLRTRDAERAQALYHQSSALAGATRDRFNVEFVLLMLGVIAHVEGHYDQARAQYAEVVAMEEEHGGVDYQSGFGHPLLFAFAQLAVATGEPAPAVRLLGAMRVIPDTEVLAAAFSIPGGLDAELAALRTQLGETTFSKAFAEGRAMTIHHAIAYAMEYK
jgi:tetratricopeptide (TPR) repeat protein